MSKRTLAVLTLVVAVVFLMSAAGCVSKKRYKTLEDQSAKQLSEANAKISDLQQKSDALDKSLKDTQAALASAESQNKKLTTDLASLKSQISALEAQKAELDKAVAAGKETEASYQKKVKNLNWAIANLKKKTADMEALIASKDAEIAKLKQSEASLTASVDDLNKKMAALTADKDALKADLDKTVASKKQTTLILGILLALAVILAIVGFARKRTAAA